MYWWKCSIFRDSTVVTIEIQSTCCELSVLFWTITMATECFLYSSLCIIIGRPGDDISSNLYSMSHTLSTGPFGSTSLVTTTAGNGIPFGAVPFLLWSLFLLIGWTVELNLRDELKSVKLTVLIQSGQNWTDQFTDSPTRASGLTSFCFFLRVFPVLVRSGPRFLIFFGSGLPVSVLGSLVDVFLLNSRNYSYFSWVKHDPKQRFNIKLKILDLFE